MALVLRVFSLYLILTALAVGVNFAVTPIYDDGSTGYPVWTGFNWAMAAAAVIALVAAGCAWARQGDAASGNPGVKVWLQTNVRFYASLALTLCFLNNWLADLIRDSADGLAWLFIDSAFVAVMLSVGLHLRRAAQDG